MNKTLLKLIIVVPLLLVYNIWCYHTNRCPLVTHTVDLNGQLWIVTNALSILYLLPINWKNGIMGVIKKIQSL